MLQDDEARQLETAKQRLVTELADRAAAPDVEALWDSVVAAFEQAPVRSFVPVLAARQVRRTLSVERPAAV